jgi:WD40 repeat protein
MEGRSSSDLVAPAAADPAHAYDLFVIHAAHDASFVRGYLLPALNLPVERVLLVDALPLGGVLVSEIDRAVSCSRYTVVVLSPAYLADRWAVFGEQLASHLAARDLRVVPLRLAACQLPPHLDARVGLDFTDPDRWDAEATRLRDLLHTAAPVRELLRCPYPGLRAFTDNDANEFFGRDDEIGDLIGRLDRNEREIYVIGPSGSGKSSLVQAGLVRALAAGSSRLERSFLVRTMRPGERPADRLAKAIDGSLDAAAAAIGALVARHAPRERVLVFVDQLEELFTIAEPAERRRFIAALRALRSIPQCYLLLAIRADFFSILLDSELGPEVARTISPLIVASLRGAALAQAIRAPAMLVGVHLEACLCDRLVADAADEPGVLPLVQETLRLLWDNRHERFLGLADYNALGDGVNALGTAIARRADTAMGGLTAAQQNIARRVLLRLVSFGEGRAHARRQQPLRALRSISDDDAELSRVVEHLVENRLLTVDRAETGLDVLVDLSHEVLITGWPALRDWIDERRADEQRRRRLDVRAAEWIERGRATTGLLDPLELSEVVQWMQSRAGHELGYGPELRLLVAVSSRERDRLAQQRRWRALRTVAMLALVSLLGYVACDQRRQAQRSSEAAHFVAVGHDLLDAHPLQAVPYFVAARADGLESEQLRSLFAEAASHAPLFAPRGRVVAQGSVASSFAPTLLLTGGDRMAQVWDAHTGKPTTAPFRLPGPARSAAFRPDGARVVIATDTAATVWDARTGEPLTALRVRRPRGAITSVTFSPSGERIASGAADGSVQVWDAATGKPVAGFQHHGAIVALAFSPDEARIATGSDDHTARLWSAATGAATTAPLEHAGGVTAVAFSPDGARVVTASQDHTARVWDVATGKPLAVLSRHAAAVTAAGFSPDGTQIVTASEDRTAIVWDASTGKPVSSPLAHDHAVTAAAFSQDGRWIVTASEHHAAIAWSVQTCAPVAAPVEPPGDRGAAPVRRDDKRASAAEPELRAWDLATPSLRGTTVISPGGTVTSAAFSADGARIVTASHDGRAIVWDAITGKPVTAPFVNQDAVLDVARRRITDQVFEQVLRELDRDGPYPDLLRFGTAAHADERAWVTSAAFSPDGTQVVTANNDGMARRWSVTTGRPLNAPLVHHGAVTAVAFSPDGTRIVTASRDGTARVWSAATGEPVTDPIEHRGASLAEVTAVAFSPDGSRLVTASENRAAWLWNAATGALVTGPLGHRDRVVTAGFSPDGRRIITASDDHTAQVWDATTGAPISAPLQHLGPVLAAAFSPDGTRVVTASDDGTARVWDAATGAPVTAPLEHGAAVRAAAFSPDGIRIVTASDDHTARIWDARTGQSLTVPLEHPAAVSTAAFSPDGARVVTASNGEVHVWTISVELGSLDDWRAFARCSPFAVADGELRYNPDYTPCVLR